MTPVKVAACILLINMCVLCGVMVYSGCGRTSCKAADTAPPESRPPVPVRVCSPRQQEYAPSVTFPGTVVTLHSREICSPVEGFLLHKYVREGERVEKGQVLMNICTRQLEQQHDLLQVELTRLKLELRRAHYNKEDEIRHTQRQFLQIAGFSAKLNYAAELCRHAEKEYRNAQELCSAGGISSEGLEDYRLTRQRRNADREDLQRQLQAARLALQPRITESDYPAPNPPGEPALSEEQQAACLQAVAAQASLRIESAESRIEELRLRISRNEFLQAACTVRAPVSGFAAHVRPLPGSYIRHGDSLLTIEKTSTLYVQGEITADVCEVLRNRKSVSIHLFQSAAADLPGRVHHISPIIDPRSGCREVFIRIETPAPAVSPGSEARVRVQTSKTRSAVSLPAEALVQQPEDSHHSSLRPESYHSEVYIVKKGRCYLRQLQILSSRGEKVYAAGDITPDERVILSPPPGLKEGSKVRTISIQNFEEVEHVP